MTDDDDDDDDGDDDAVAVGASATADDKFGRFHCIAMYKIENCIL